MDLIPFDNERAAIKSALADIRAGKPVAFRVPATPAPRLADPRPPVPPAHVPPTADVKPHTVVAWRHVGPLAVTTHRDREAALDHARGLSWAIFWKWNVLHGRDFVDRGVINPPADLSPEQVNAVIGG